MSLKKQPDDKPRREKENMDEPQEEFIDLSSIPSHPKQASESETEKQSTENGDS